MCCVMGLCLMRTGTSVTERLAWHHPQGNHPHPLLSRRLPAGARRLARHTPAGNHTLEVKVDSDVKRLLEAVFDLQLEARELVRVGQGLYDRAITIAIHDAECMSQHREMPKVPVKASEEEL